MPKVLIVGKTKMREGLCFGGIMLVDDRSIRLLPESGHSYGKNAPFNLGEIWNLELKELSKHEVAAPHTEDVRVISKEYVKGLSRRKLRDRILRISSAPLVYPHQLFDSKLRYSQNKRAFIRPGEKGLNYSTGFWRFRHALHLCRENGKLRYAYCDNDYSCDLDDDDLELDVPYVGCEPAIDKIPAETLLRFSLARWENKPCYLMLSGWFL